ncbi:hypothetical protein B0H13DRAFT_1914357 [Mycena leptocephala]|nr:hypothetical protein B0H13DRAFT_1914357 [Mycena leptocephala]
MCLGSGIRCPTLPGSKLASTTVPNPLAERNEARSKHEQLVSVYTLPQQGNPTIQCRGVTRSEMWSRTPHLEISKPRSAYPFLCLCQEWHEICVSNTREVGYESYPYDRERPNTGMCADKYTSPFPSYRMATGGFGALWEYSGLVGRTEYPTQDIMDVPQSGIMCFRLPATKRAHGGATASRSAKSGSAAMHVLICPGGALCVFARPPSNVCTHGATVSGSRQGGLSGNGVPQRSLLCFCPPGTKRAHTRRYWVRITPKRAHRHHAHPEPIAFEPVKLGITTTFHACRTARAHTMSCVVTIAQEHRQEPMHNYCATARSCTYTLPCVSLYTGTEHTLALVPAALVYLTYVFSGSVLS